MSTAPWRRLLRRDGARRLAAGDATGRSAPLAKRDGRREIGRIRPIYSSNITWLATLTIKKHSSILNLIWPSTQEKSLSRFAFLSSITSFSVSPTVTDSSWRAQSRNPTSKPSANSNSISSRKSRKPKPKPKRSNRKRTIAASCLPVPSPLKELDANPSGAFADALLGMLKHHLTRAADRELFGLPPLPKEPKPAPEPAAKPFLMAEASGGSFVRQRIKPRRNFRRGFPSPRRDDFNNHPRRERSPRLGDKRQVVSLQMIATVI